MKPPLIILFFLLGVTSVKAQYFNIFPNVCDSLENGQFHYHVSGFEEFNDSLVLHVELIENAPNDSIIIIFNRSYDFSDPAMDTTGLTFNEADNIFEIELGTFPSDYYFLHIWVTLNGAVFNEMYYQE